MQQTPGMIRRRIGEGIISIGLGLGLGLGLSMCLPPEGRAQQHKDSLVSATQLIEGEKYFITEEYARAEDFFLRSLREDSKNAAAHYKLSQLYMRQERFSKAFSHARKAFRLHPDNAYYYLQAIEVLLRRYDLSGAAKLYERMMKHVPQAHQYLYDLGEVYLKLGDYKRALDAYQRLEEAEGYSKELGYKKQYAYLKQEDEEAALQEAKRLCETYPLDKKLLALYAELLVVVGRAAEAVSYLRAQVEKDPYQVELTTHLADLYLAQDQPTEAYKVLLRVFSREDISPEKKLSVFRRYVRDDLSSAKVAMLQKLSTQLVDMYPDRSEMYVTRGDFYLMLGQKASAMEDYLQALKQGASSFVLWKNVLSLGIAQNRYAEVIAQGEKALALYPEQAILYFFKGVAHYFRQEYELSARMLSEGDARATHDPELGSVINAQLGDVYHSMGTHAASDEAYEKAIRLHPNNDHALNNYSYFLAVRKENLDRAIALSTYLVKHFGDNPSYLDTHAWVLYRKERYVEAKRFLERAMKLHGRTNATIIEHYGDVLYKLGEVEKAVEQWKQAKEHHVSSERLDRKIADRKLYED